MKFLEKNSSQMNEARKRINKAFTEYEKRKAKEEKRKAKEESDRIRAIKAKKAMLQDRTDSIKRKIKKIAKRKIKNPGIGKSLNKYLIGKRMTVRLRGAD